jgi:hypothetical protein
MGVPRALCELVAVAAQYLSGVRTRCFSEEMTDSSDEQAAAGLSKRIGSRAAMVEYDDHMV